MDRHPDDLTAADDLALVEAARAGDRLAFGVLYLRHHAAAWRIACVVSRFSPDAELAVIEGFTRVFAALPREAEEFEGCGTTFRPYLLACVRQAALDRARAAGRAEPDGTRHRARAGRPPASPPSPTPLAGLAPDGELVLSSLEHHVARGALAALPERARTAFWLSEVEAMTPTEVAGILGAHPEVVAALTAGARADVQAAQEAAQGRHEVRAGCRFTIDHLGDYHAGTLDPKQGVLVRSHLDLCPPCRMRLGELANAPATLAVAVPAAPLLGGEAQHHWLTSAAAVRPAERLLPPGLAAAAPGAARHLPDLRGPRRDRRGRRRLSVVPVGLPVVARMAGRTAWPTVPAVALVVAWLGVMVALPRLMEPATAPGPDGLALPAVQAYVPNYLPGAAKPGSFSVTRSQPSHSGPAASVIGGGTGGEAAVALISTAASPRSRARAPRPEANAPVAAALDRPVEVVRAVVPTPAPTELPLVAVATLPPPPAVSQDSKPGEDAKRSKDSKPKIDPKESERRKQPVPRVGIVTA